MPLHGGPASAAQSPRLDKRLQCPRWAGTVEPMGLLTDDSLRQFAADGYLLLPGLVSETLLAEADAEVDNLIATTSPTGEGDLGPGVNAWFQPQAELPRCAAALCESFAMRAAQELVAPHRLENIFDQIQISTTRPPWSHIPGGPHIDGHGPDQDPPHSFTMLAGILLTDQRPDQSGNLWVWPGSHLDHQRLFAERGSKVLQSTGGHATLLDPPLALGAGVPIRGQRGDVLLAHFLLGHNKGGNTAPYERRTLYYRLGAPQHADRWEATFLDSFTEYLPVKEAAAATRR